MPFIASAPLVLITGATSGFGAACARKFAAHGYALILTGRREDRLRHVMHELVEKHASEVLTLCFDIRNRKEVQKHLGGLTGRWTQIDVLVNNAGLALGRDAFQDANIDDWETMLDTNVKGLMYATRAILPFMIERKKGHIINMGSIAGKEVYPHGNGYCASKFAVDALSKSMRIDLLPHGIRVTAIHPGAAETEFSTVRFKGDAEKAAATYSGYQPLRAEDVAEIVYCCCMLPEHVCINELVVTATAQANSTTFHKTTG
jgi:NADP-dependent 3-hydroxy acid dehydrogenase YdfG